MLKRFIGGLAVTVLALALPATGLADPNRTLTLPGIGAATGWNGGPINGTGVTDADATTPCMQGVAECDDTLLKVGAIGKLTVTTGNASTGASDLDLFVYKSNAAGDAGASLGSSAGSDANETVVAELDATGYVLVRVRAAVSAMGTYQGTAKLTEGTHTNNTATFPPAPVTDPTAADPPPAMSADGTTSAGGSTSTTTTGPGTTTTVTTTTPAPASSTQAPVANKAPRAYVAMPKSVKGLKVLKGTAADDGRVKTISVGVTKLVGKSCFGLKKSGAFTKLKSCKKPVLIRAKGTTSWSFKLKHALPKGSYVVYARAVDSAGKVQSGFTGTSRRTLRVR